MANKKMIKYGKKDLLAPGDLDLKNAKILISTRLDGEVLAAVKAAAAAAHVPYQTLINQTLREMFVSPAAARDLSRLMGVIDELKERVTQLEQRRKQRFA